MAGSSLDGIDVAVCAFHYLNSELKDWSLDRTGFYPIEKSLASKIRNYKDLSKIDFEQLENDVTLSYADAIQEFIGEESHEIDLVGVHGQTLFHFPKEKRTCQLGKGNVIAKSLGIPTVDNFRIADILQGGEGTPMAPLADCYLYPGYDYYLNLGGIANISSVDKNGKWKAYDVCPFNQVLNYFAKKLGKEFDQNGELGAKGQLDTQLFENLRKLDFFKLPSPKSLDNNWIVEYFIPLMEKSAGSPQDMLRTVYVLFAELIANDLEERPESRSMLVSGGGAYNKYFIENLQASLNKKNIEVVIPATEVIDFKEAALIALAASFRMLDKPNFFKEVTGAKVSVSGGDLYMENGIAQG